MKYASLVLMSLAVVLDRIVKFAAQNFTLHGGSLGFLTFTYLRNDGATMGILKGDRILLVTISTVALVVLVFLWFKAKSSSISHFGYIGVFFILLIENIGIPFPAETTLSISGFEWMKSAFSLFPLLLSVAIGNIIGSTIAYGIGYYLGRPVIVRFGRYIGITEERLDVADKKFAKFRGTIVLFGKFIAGIRVLIPYLAGINRMPFLLFSVYNAVSAVVWGAFSSSSGVTLR